MLHHKKTRKFGRVRKVRAGLIKSLLSELAIRGRIKTTFAKAKEIRPIMEKLITRGKKGTLASLKILLASNLNKEAATKIFKEISPKFSKRQGGYTRISKLGPRKSDSAEMAVIEFVE